MKKLVFVLIALVFLCGTASAKPQQKVYVLKKPEKPKDEVRSKYSNPDWGFAFDLRDGFTFTESEIDDKGTFNLNLTLDGYPLQAALTIEPVEEKQTSVKYWKQMQEADPNLETLIVYERGRDIGGAAAMQVRLEGQDQTGHFLIISGVIASEGRGYSLSVFCDDLLFEETPDFFDEIADGFTLISPDDEPSESVIPPLG